LIARGKDAGMMVTLDFSLGPDLTAEQAERISALGKEAVLFAWREQARMLRAQQASTPTDVTPATPSGQTPTCLKSPPKKHRKKAGKKPGSPGGRRPQPVGFDETKEHRAKTCPGCGGSLNRCRETRERYTEDIPDDLKPTVTRHVIHRDWCPACKKHVAGKVPDALPQPQLGHRTLVFSAWLHYVLGNTLSQILAIFNHHLRLKLTDSGLLSMWHRLAGVLRPRYEQIRDGALESAVLHGGDSGWRVNGKTHGLWCFCTQDLTFYLIDRSRGSPALRKIFCREFAGTLVSDFWGAYNAFTGSAAHVYGFGCAEVPGASAARIEAHDEVQVPRRERARLSEETPAAHPRRDPVAQAARRLDGGCVRLAPRENPQAAAGDHRHRPAGQQRPPADQTPEAAQRRVVHVSRSTRRPLRQQPRRTGNPAGGDPAKKQLRQPQRTWGRNPGNPGERSANPQTTRARAARTAPNHPDSLRRNRPTAAAASKSYSM
jgi:hypothetical protein